METRDLKTFVTVALLLNFNQASKVLHTAQSTVSLRIRALEEELKTRLFDRLGRRVMLTAAGERLLEYARKMLTIEEEARAWVGGEEKVRGELTIRMPETLCLFRMSKVFHEFRAAYPNVRVRLLSSAHDGLGEELRKGVTDLAFLLADNVQSGDMRVECLGTEPLVVAVSPKHPLASCAMAGPSAFRSETVLLPVSHCSYRGIVERALAEAGVVPAPGLDFSSITAVKRYVAEGLGITILPGVAVEEERASGTLAVLPWAGGELEAMVLMLHHKDKWLTPALQGFMDLCRVHVMQS